MLLRANKRDFPFSISHFSLPEELRRREGICEVTNEKFQMVNGKSSSSSIDLKATVDRQECLSYKDDKTHTYS
jgi:hypothetical protein